MKQTGLKRNDVGNVISALLAAISQALDNGERVRLAGFGTLFIRERKSRAAINPKTGERLNVPAKLVPVFRPSRELKKIVN